MGTMNFNQVATQRDWSGVLQEKNQVKPVRVATSDFDGLRVGQQHG